MTENIAADILRDANAETPDETLRRVVAEAKAEEHPLLHTGDIVTVGRETRYVVELAMRSIVVLKQTDRERRRRLVDPEQIARITIVEPSPETQAVLDANAAASRVQSATRWMQGTLEGLRDNVTTLRKRFDDRLATGRVWDEYLLSSLGDLQVAIELVEGIDAELAENAENEIVEPLWETIITVATYQAQYGRGAVFSSEPYHRARSQQLGAAWVQLLTTAISVKAHAEDDKRHRRY